MKRFLFALILMFAPGLVFAAGFSLYQGDTLVLPVARGEGIVAATFGGQPASVFPYRGRMIAVAGIGLTQNPGIYNLRIKYSDGTQFVKPVTVLRKKFPVVNLPVPEKLNETPEQLVTNLQSANGNLSRQVATRTPEIYFTAPFGLPLADNRKIGSVFGEIRKTGDQIIRHLGTDFSAASGTPVGAINAGVVKDSYYDASYGNSVLIDHGQGIYSLYLHLNERRVKVGQAVRMGEIIGTVGQTGFATGPHLHLSIKINGVSVDPLRFVRALSF